MPEDYAENFATTDLEHEAVEKYKPEYKGLGGEHLVYSVKDHPNVVVKVKSGVAMRSVQEHRNGSPKSVDDFKDDIDKDRERLKKFRYFFGKEHTLNQRYYAMEVPVNGRILNELNERYSRHFFDEDEIVDFPQTEIATVVAIQEVSDVFDDKSSISVTSGYAEHSRKSENQEFIDAYNRVTQDAIIDTTSQHSITKEDFCLVHPRLKGLLDKMDEDPKIEAQVRDFVKKSIGYTRLYGETLDLAGDGNAMFFQNQEDEWDYVLPDALYPSRVNALENAHKVFEDYNDNGDDVLEQRAPELLNTINYVRTINGLANILGEEDRIEMIPEGVDVSAQQLLDAIKQDPEEVRLSRKEMAIARANEIFGELEDEQSLTGAEIAEKLRNHPQYSHKRAEHRDFVENMEKVESMSKEDLINLFMST